MSGRMSYSPASQACMAISWEEAPAPATVPLWPPHAASASSAAAAAIRRPYLRVVIPSPVDSAGWSAGGRPASDRLRGPVLRRRHELVPQTPHRQQHPRPGGLRLDLRPDPLDVDVEGLGVPDVVRAPYPVDELPTGEHVVDVAHEDLEQLELAQRDADGLAVDVELVAGDVHPHVAHLQHPGGGVVLGARTAAQDRAHPGDELAVGVGLGDVVVGAELQAEHLVELEIGRAHV